MKHLKKFVVGGLVALAVAATSVTTFAASSYRTPAEAAAGVTGKTLEEVITEHHSGKSYGAIAAGAGKLKEFQQAVLEMKKERLSGLVSDGVITQEQADARLDAVEQRQAVCDGSGAGCGYGGYGYYGHDHSHGHGRGRGMGRHNGSCLYQ